jgi:hypothetical protein
MGTNEAIRTGHREDVVLRLAPVIDVARPNVSCRSKDIEAHRAASLTTFPCRAGRKERDVSKNRHAGQVKCMFNSTRHG